MAVNIFLDVKDIPRSCSIFVGVSTSCFSLLLVEILELRQSDILSRSAPQNDQDPSGQVSFSSGGRLMVDKTNGYLIFICTIENRF